DMDTMQKNLLESVVEIFSEDILGIFREEISHYLPKDVELPPLPEVGTLEIEEVRNSLYFYG
ncbi:MAG: hypothetical protein QGF32_06545, partial [Candidatus Thalassarchaeaceae archaeon]|nr:hypothetical protein [Candidatus Thalassarchaeaceae archaeon]